jgi:V/A-type H+-transporting ATPase subunit A
VVARILREDFLQQSSYHPVDRFCPLDKARWMLEAIMEFHHKCRAALELGVRLEQISALPVVGEFARMKNLATEEAEAQIKVLMDRVRFSFAELGVS